MADGGNKNMTVAAVAGAPSPPAGGIPRVDGGLPFLGHALELRRDPVGLLTRGWRSHGDLFEVTAMGRRFAVFLGPQAHEAYFRAPDDVLSQKEVYQFTVPIFGPGVAYDASPELMAEQVGFLYPAVREGRLQTYADRMFDETAAYVDGWADEGEIDVLETMNALTVNIACGCLLGPEIRSQLYQGFDALYHDLQGGINLLGFFFPALPTPTHVRRDRARRAVGRLIGGIVAERRRTGRATEDFMQTLMDARYEDGRPLSDGEITGILITALFAGQHTSAVLAAWTGLELARHPDVAAGVRNEIESVYADADSVSLESLRRQAKLECAVREAERLHPPLIILVRKVLKDFDYRGRRIPAGTMAMVSPAAAHRLPEVFADPETFDPGRFATADGVRKVDPYTLITFGGGKHVCIGLHFAYMQVKVIWSALLSRFEFAPVAPTPQPDYGAWVTGPKPPARVRFRRRPASEAVL